MTLASSSSGPLVARDADARSPSTSIPGWNVKSPGAGSDVQDPEQQARVGRRVLLDPRRVELEADRDVVAAERSSGSSGSARCRARSGGDSTSARLSSARSSFGFATRTRLRLSCCSRPRILRHVEEAWSTGFQSVPALWTTTPSRTSPTVAAPHGAREQVGDRGGADHETAGEVDDGVDDCERDRGRLRVLRRAVDRSRRANEPPSSQRAAMAFVAASSRPSPSSTRRPPGGLVPARARK